jgi:Ser/Thr protein kinase RdoA (MazF antagonist)
MTADHTTVLAAFGIGRAAVARAPSLVSAVFRVDTEDGRTWYLKEHPARDAEHVRWADTVADRLGSQGIRAPRLRQASSGEPFAVSNGRLYTLAAAVRGRPLDRAQLHDPVVGRRVARFVARVHEALRSAPPVPAPPRPSLWHDTDHAARADAARAQLLALPASPERADLVRAVTLVAQEPAMQRPLDALAVPQGLVHGDLWPGNVLVSAPNLTAPDLTAQDLTVQDLAVLDLENTCRAPLLLDVAHFVDLAFRDPDDCGRLDVDRATAFARDYATAAGATPDALACLPDLTLAARGCTFLWTAERHLEIGPNPLDPLVAADVARVEHVLSIRDRWSDELSCLAGGRQLP